MTGPGHEGAGSAERGEPAVPAIDRAQAYLEANRPELARREVLSALQLAPNDAQLHALLGQVHRATEDWSEAEKCYHHALALEPENPDFLVALGIVLMEQGRHPQAEEAVLQALRLAPQWAAAYRVYALLMYRTGHLEKSRKLLDRSLALDPEDRHAHQLLALLHSEEQRHEVAGVHAHEGLAASPDSALSHTAIGVALLRSGHPFRARRALREALRLDPGDPEREQLFLEADGSCRVVYLPMYYWSLLVERIPGRAFGVWGLFVAFVLVARQVHPPNGLVGAVVLSYLALCVYTWIAHPLLKLWLRMRPPR